MIDSHCLNDPNSNSPLKRETTTTTTKTQFQPFH